MTLSSPTLILSGDAEAAVFCLVRPIAGVQNSFQNKAVVCGKGTGCVLAAAACALPDDTVTHPVRSMSPPAG